MNSTDAALAVLAGAFVYHVWSEIKMIKTATGISTKIVSLDSLIQMGDHEEPGKPEPKIGFGFSPTTGGTYGVRPLL